MVLFVGVFCSCGEDNTAVDNNIFGGQSDDDDDSDDDNDDDSPKLVTYTYPEVIVADAGQGFLQRSKLFEVTVSNDEVTNQSVYVMEDRNSYEQSEGKSENMTDYNHIANFSFEGNVTVKIKRLDGGGDLSKVTLYPKQKGYTYTVEGDQIVISLSQWAYIYVEYDDLIHKDPLFIFADPLLENIPDLSSNSVEVLTPEMSAEDLKYRVENTTKSTIYFTEGVYDFGQVGVNGTSYAGYQIPLMSNKQYYIPGGAVIVGSFKTPEGESTNNNRFFGHGIVTAAGKDRLPNDQSIPYNLYMAYGGTNNVIDGVHFVAASHFAILSRGTVETINSKMFGWWHQTDGWGGEDDASVVDSFIKGNDDNIKIYSNRQKVKNVIIYKQMNGAAIQFGWGQSGNAQDCTIEDLYIIQDDPVGSPPNDADEVYPDNGSVINLRNNDGSTIKNIYFKNIYVENNVQYLFGLQNNGGSISNITVENLYHDGANNRERNYLISTKNDGVYGTFSGIKFKNLVLNGRKITSDDDAEWNLKQLQTDNMDKSAAQTSVNLTDIIYE